MSEEIEKSVVIGVVEELAVDVGEAPQLVAEATPAPVEERLPSAGEQLRSARETRGMTIAEAAQALMLAPRQIEAIEQDDWTKLPGDTFARGFIRNYARLLKLDSEALLRRNAEQRAAAEAPNIELPQALAAEIPQPSHAKKRDKVTIIAAAAMVVVALLVYFLLPENLFAPKAAEPQVAAPVPAAVADVPAAPVPAVVGSSADNNGGAGMVAPTPVVVPTSSAPAAAAAVAVAPPVPAPVVAAPAVPVVPVPAAAPAKAAPAVAAPAAPTAAAKPAVPVAGAVHLKFNFSQDAWVEVTDKTGQKLISSKNLAGSQREAVGVPPLTLVIGNATHVKVSADGKVLDLSPRSKDDVARLIVQ